MKKNNYDKGNVVHFPNLSTKLVEKGMEALKEKQHRDSLVFFEQLLELEPDHQQALFGKTINLVELGRLKEATHLCEKMLTEDIGDYFDVLQVYISILVQLGKYKQVVTMLEAVIEEEKLPPNLAESFFQLLDFSRKMDTYQDGGNESEQLPIVEEAQLIDDLNSHNLEKQLIAVQQLSKQPFGKSFTALKNYMQDESKNPILKSIILQMFVEQNMDETIYIHKFSEKVTVNPSLLKNINDDEFSQSVKHLLSEAIEPKNPSLFQVCLQMWWHYLFAIFPLQPKPADKFIWAAGLHYTSSQSLGLNINMSEIEQTYAIEEHEVLMISEQILKIENYSLKEYGWDS